jgi:hypothetical protein
LADYDVDWLFWGPVERKVGAFDPHTAPYLRQVYNSEGYVIFEIEP